MAQNEIDRRWFFFSVDVEISNYCDEQCLMCGHSELKRPCGMMPRETFFLIAQALAPQNSRLVLSGLGNPLSHPDWAMFIEEYKRTGATIGAVVHASALNDKNREDLLAVRPSFLEVSFPSLIPDVFRELCPNSSYGDSLAALKSLIDDDKRKFPVVVCGIETAKNPGEAASFNAFFRDRGIPSRMMGCHSRARQVPAAPVITRDSFVGGASPCGLFAIHSFISFNGKLLSCCHDLTGETELADISVDPLSLLASRKAERSAEVVPFRICETCDDRWRLLPLPQGPYPQSRKERKRALKSLVENYPV